MSPRNVVWTDRQYGITYPKISGPDGHASGVVAVLSQKRGRINQMHARRELEVIRAYALLYDRHSRSRAKLRLVHHLRIILHLSSQNASDHGKTERHASRIRKSIR